MGNQTIASVSDFSGGHWLGTGPASADANQWGGTNMAVSRRGGVAPVSAARVIDVASTSGRVWGQRWAWGLDGNLYYVQEGGATAAVRRFDPNAPGAVAITVTDCGTVAVPSYTPDWVIANSRLYLTIYGTASYVIDPTALTTTLITGASGDAPAGRTIAVYGERMLVAGISDARFGTFPARICYSEAGDFTDWPSLNFYDVGAGDHQVRALVPMADRVLIVLDDGQVFQGSGVPGVNFTLRRFHGFERAAGAVTALQAQHVAVDPSQTKAWLYDHTTRGINRFNGASLTRAQGVGMPAATRTMTGEYQGDLAVIGGPDDLFVGRVALPRVGSEVAGEKYGLLRLSNAWASIDVANVFGENF